MICTNCGAHLMETDQFCPKCGTKAIKDLRCPDCGALLRDGVKFCPKCGRSVGKNGNARRNFDDTLDIPIDAIERNILSETAAEIKADRRAESVPRKTTSRGTSSTSTPPHGQAQSTSVKKKVSNSEAPVKKKVSNSEAPVKKKVSSPETPVKKRASNPEPPVKKRVSNPEPPRRKKRVYREDDWEDDDWEEDDWEDDDWDEDDDEGGVDFITVMTAVVGCVLLVVVAVLGFHLYRQYIPKDYGQAAEEEQEEQGQDQGNGPEDGQGSSGGDGRETYTLKVIHNVNVRDNPSTSGTNVLKVAQEGETYTSYGSPDGGEWYEILLEDGSVGYVFHEYISID